MNKVSVPSRLDAWLNNIPIQDPVERQIASLFQVVLIGLMVVIILATILLVAIPTLSVQEKVSVVTSDLIGFLVVGLTLSLLRRGYFRSSAMIIITILFITPTLAITVVFDLLNSGGILFQFTLATLLASLLVSRRALAITFALSAVVVGFAAFRGQNAAPELAMANLQTAANFILFNGLIAVVIDRFGLTLHDTLKTTLERESKLKNEINERKQAEEALYKSEGRLRQAMYIAQLGIWDWDIATDKTTWQGNMFNIYGVSPEEFTGNGADYIAFTREDYRQAQAENIGRAFEQGVTEEKLYRGVDIPLDPKELCIVQPDGTEVYTLGDAIAIVDEKGAPVRMIGVTMDITTRKRAEEKIERQNQRLKVLREIDTAIIAADSVENIVGAALSHIRELIDCRRASLSLFDWETDEATIFDVRMIGKLSVPKGTRMALAPLQGMIQTLAQKQPVLINDLSTLADPPPLIQSHISNGLRSMCLLPLFSQRNLIGSLSLFSESTGFFDEERIGLGREVANQVASAITQSRLVAELQYLNSNLEQRVEERTRELAQANEQLRELDQLKDQFVANVSHELRTPLTNLSLYLNLLGKRRAEGLDRYLPILNRESQHLANLIEDLLTLSRLEQDQTALLREPQMVDRLITEVLEAHTVRAEAKSLTLVHQPDPAVPAVLVDRAQMIQVFTNLIGNAVAYTIAGGRVTVTTAVTEMGTQLNATVRVHSTSPPIPPQDLPHLFERFYRGQTGRESGEPGTGLGLAICKEIVEQHGGQIGVTSAEGFGCEFEVRLPVPE
jgi:signal transduction histidine kinase/PAS domain-containing protein